MDDTDTRLLSLLRQDGRAALSNLAATLGVSRATVKARIDRLEERGVILGFTVVLKGDAGAPAVRAIMMIEVEGKAGEPVIRRLRGMPEVRELHSTNGRWDIAAELTADSLETFDALLNRIRAIDGVASSETNILLATRK